MVETGRRGRGRARVRKERPPRVSFEEDLSVSRSLLPRFFPFPRMAANVTRRGVSSLLVIDARSKVCRAAGCNDRRGNTPGATTDSILSANQLDHRSRSFLSTSKNPSQICFDMYMYTRREDELRPRNLSNSKRRNLNSYRFLTFKSIIVPLTLKNFS